MRGYGQFCPLALAAEHVGERWTPLVLRELMLGARRFNDIHRGVPRMSPALLTRRLRRLEAVGVLARQRTGAQVEYRLTEAGEALRPVIETLAVWGKQWLPADLSDGRSDPDLVMWDMHRRIETRRLPPSRTVIRFDFTDQPVARRLRWLLCNAEDVELCIQDPGGDVDLFVSTDSCTLTRVWFGDLPLHEALADGRIDLHGPRWLREAFPEWLKLSVVAPVPRIGLARTGLNT